MQDNVGADCSLPCTTAFFPTFKMFNFIPAQINDQLQIKLYTLLQLSCLVIQKVK